MLSFAPLASQPNQTEHALLLLVAAVGGCHFVVDIVSAHLSLVRALSLTFPFLAASRRGQTKTSEPPLQALSSGPRAQKLTKQQRVNSRDSEIFDIVSALEGAEGKGVTFCEQALRSARHVNLYMLTRDFRSRQTLSST